MRLVDFWEISEKQYLDYILEWEETKELIVPWASRREGRLFKDIREGWEESETEVMRERGLVPATLYFMIDENDVIVSAIHLRHELNDYLLKHGGHLGYGVKPSLRQKGYATIMLNKMLEELKTKGYDRILITCDDDNIGSAKTIESNGGCLENKIVDNDVLVRRYWIDLN